MCRETTLTKQDTQLSERGAIDQEKRTEGVIQLCRFIHCMQSLSCARVSKKPLSGFSCVVAAANDNILRGLVQRLGGSSSSKPRQSLQIAIGARDQHPLGDLLPCWSTSRSVAESGARFELFGWTKGGQKADVAHSTR